MSEYAKEERIAIRMESGMPESRAIDLTDAEIRKAKLNAPKEPESITKLRALRQVQKFKELERRGGSGSRKVLSTGDKDE